MAVDIFRERVFLRSEEHGSRIISLLQLHEEVEGLGDVLLTGELRARLAEEAAAARAGTDADGIAETDPSTPGGQRSGRRRRRRGSGPSTPPSEPE